MKKFNLHAFPLFILLLTGLLCFNGCSKDEPEIEEELQFETVMDIDNNVYKTVLIGDQWWMAENLRVKHFNDGVSLQTDLTNNEWEATTSAAWAVYPHTELQGLNSDQEVLEAYGALYNWKAASHNLICPVGWRIPSSQDWDILFENTGGQSLAGEALRSQRVTPMEHPRWEINQTPTDNYGFSALPAGRRGVHGDYVGSGEMTYFWKTDGAPTHNSHYIFINSIYDHITTVSATSTIEGRSIRCIMKD